LRHNAVEPPVSDNPKCQAQVIAYKWWLLTTGFSYVDLTAKITVL